LRPACPKPGARRTLASADQVDAILDHAHLPAWNAADIGASARLPDGRIVWLFGDTLRSGLNPGLVSNSMLVSAGSCVSQLTDPQHGAVIPDPGAHLAYWPMSVVVLPGATDRLVVLCARIRRGTSGGGGLDFTFLGTSAAVFDVAHDAAPVLRGITSVTPDNPSTTQVNWGAAAFATDKWIYVYGSRLTGEKGIFGRELLVCRVPADSPRDAAAFRFWDGATWQAKASRARPVLAAEHGVSQTLSVDRLGPSDYTVVSKRDGDLGDFAYVWHGGSPTGPFTAHKAFSAPSNSSSGELQYAPLAHPEIAMADGGLLMSVSRNTTDLARLNADPSLGVPRFVEVKLG
jgi:hypothetical protein